MTRQPRIKSKLDNQVYHVMTRTIRRSYLFDNDGRKEWIYKEIQTLASIYCVDLFAVTVMSNHYHIVLSMRKPLLTEAQVQQRFERYQARIKRPAPWRPWLFKEWSKRLTDLSRFMQDLNRNISINMNTRDRTHGHFWGERYKSVLIDDDEGLFRCMVYVEMNSVRAGLCQRPSEYRFCSAGRFHLGGAGAAGVTIPKMKNLNFCRSGKERQRAFGLFCDHVADKDAERETESAYLIPDKVMGFATAELADLVLRRTQWAVYSLVLGSEEFCRTMMDRFKIRPLAAHSNPYALTDTLFNTHQRAGPHAHH